MREVPLSKTAAQPRPQRSVSAAARCSGDRGMAGRTRPRRTAQWRRPTTLSSTARRLTSAPGPPQVNQPGASGSRSKQMENSATPRLARREGAEPSPPGPTPTMALKAPVPFIALMLWRTIRKNVWFCTTYGPIRTRSYPCSDSVGPEPKECRTRAEELAAARKVDEALGSYGGSGHSVHPSDDTSRSKEPVSRMATTRWPPTSTSP
mmetsp:Transcript_26668/g.83079  ORF Transcript_26668/g.83079 Transcript_26668/m.83079 type:complete len:207 (+) Transcript_26668:853-1473(+)